jgi:hypothetical protein
MRNNLTVFFSLMLLVIPTWAQDDDKAALSAAESFFESASVGDYEDALPHAGLSWPTDPKQLEVLRAFGFSTESSYGKLKKCEQNLKNFATAMEMYATDHAGKYPTDSGLLTPNYFRSLPTCPNAKDTSYSMTSAKNPDSYLITCLEGNHRKGSSMNPSYDSTYGLETLPAPWIAYITDVETEGEAGSFRLIRGKAEGAIFRPSVDTTFKLEKSEGKWQIDPSSLVEPVKEELSKPPKWGWIGMLNEQKDLDVLLAVLDAWDDPEMSKLVDTYLCRYRLARVAGEVETFTYKNGEAPERSEIKIGVCPLSGKQHGYEALETGSRIWCVDSPHSKELEILTGEASFAD